jgi:hypothetical protein
MSYAVHVEHFYYQGTFNTPQDGIVSVHETRAEAEAARKEADPNTNGTNRYYLRHGEYAIPAYKVIGINRQTFEAFQRRRREYGENES